MRRLLATCAILALATSGCDSGGSEQQRFFELQAFSEAPSGFTERTADGTLGNVDPEDWQVGPYFVGRAQVIQIPSPNPTRPDAVVTLELSTFGMTNLGLYMVRSDGELRLLDTDPGNANAAFPRFTFFGSSVTDSGVPGLYRVYVLDALNRLVTYGDIRLL